MNVGIWSGEAIWEGIEDCKIGNKDSEDSTLEIGKVELGFGRQRIGNRDQEDSGLGILIRNTADWE